MVLSFQSDEPFADAAMDQYNSPTEINLSKIFENTGSRFSPNCTASHVYFVEVNFFLKLISFLIQHTCISE